MAVDVSTAIKTALEDAVRTGPSRPTTRSAALKAALADHSDLIVKAIGQGYSPTGLAKKLKASGISASIESLRQSLQAIAATASNGSKTKPAKSSAKTATSRSSSPGSRAKSKAFEAEDRTA